MNPLGIAIRGYLGDALSIAVDGYIYPTGRNQFDFVEDFMGNFMTDFMVPIDQPDD